MEGRRPPPEGDDGGGGWLPPQPPPGPGASHQPPQPPPGPSQQPLPGRSPFEPAAPPGSQPAQPVPPPVSQPLPPSPGNGEAVAAFVCAVTGAALLVVSLGLSTIISLVLGIVALPYARRGLRNVEQGRTRKHADLARAGRVVGIVTIVLAALATLFWLAMLLLALGGAFEDDGRWDGDGDLVLSGTLRLAAGLLRLLA